MSDRDVILGRVRAALADVDRSEPAAWSPDADRDASAAYRRDRVVPSAELAELFAERCGAYRAQVTRCDDSPGQIAAAVAGACARHRATRLVVAPGLQPTWLPDSLVALADDPPLTPAQLDASDGVVTGCALAIADTGTIVLDAGPGQGRRALTLIPDLHVCIVRAEQVLAAVPEAIQGLAASVADRRPLTFISGPSATSDIELKRVEGVHGPRRLEVILAGPKP